MLHLDCTFKKYSFTAINEIISDLINNLDISEHLKKIILTSILQIFNTHNINNLRTLEKGINFIKLLIKHIDFCELTDSEIFELITISLAIVIEKIEQLYSKEIFDTKDKDKSIVQIILEEQEKEPYCIIKNYLKEPALFSNKSTVIKHIINIYDDIDLSKNFYAINKLYKDVHIIKENDEDVSTFYLSEEKLKQRINTFYKEYVLKVNESIDINNWFKQLNEMYHYAEVIGIQNIFKEEEIYIAMDRYLEKLEMKERLYNIIDKHIPNEIKSDKMKEFNTVLNNKIINRYYNNCIEKILKQTEEGIFEIKNLDTLFSIFSENNFDGKSMIIEKIKENQYFIHNLNYDINYDKWGWTHSIWGKANSYRSLRDNSFEEIVYVLLKEATKVGKYRIESLNSQYRIEVQDNSEET